MKAQLSHSILTIPLNELVPIIIPNLHMEKLRYQRMCQNTLKTLKCYASVRND